MDLQRHEISNIKKPNFSVLILRNQAFSIEQHSCDVGYQPIESRNSKPSSRPAMQAYTIPFKSNTADS